jgi:cytochrome c oxidase subunit 2
VCFRFRASANATPSKRTHHTVLEIAWTAVPVLILVVIAIPSFKLLYFMDRVAEPELTIKAIGHQWYWSYEYPDDGDFTFDAYMVADEDLEPGQPRLLATDNAIVLPVDTDIQVLVTAADVLHSWAVPAFGVKMDGVPGRINETWLRIEEPGIYYGQCSELCGDYHGFMPIMVRAVSKEEFDAWTRQAQEEFARAGNVDVAQGEQRSE